MESLEVSGAVRPLVRVVRLQRVNVRLLYYNLDGGRGLSVAVGVRFVLARIVQVDLLYIPKSFRFPLICGPCSWCCILLKPVSERQDHSVNCSL